MVTTRARPLSPHMTIWRWRVHMYVSILHRVTGHALAFGAVLIFLWWLVAAATGPGAYAVFHDVATSWFGILVGVGVTWVFFQHMGSGIRHLIMDTGSGYEITKSRTMSRLTFAFSILMTLILWAVVLL
jgi:succinate dehydrogenase / fumarate reductase cytochrome b subunit